MKDFYIEPKKQEMKYRRLAKLGLELGIPIPETFLEMQVKMPNGEVTHRHKQRSHSWNRNYYNLIFVQSAAKNAQSSFGPGLMGWKLIDGSVQGASRSLSIKDFNGVEAMATGYRADVGITMGLVVGTSGVEESFEDYALGSLVANGTGAGQMNYVATETPTKSYDAETKTMTVQHMRYINNNSGGDISIQEVGIYAYGKVSGDVSVMVCRDVLLAPVVVPASGQLKVIYQISLTYPS
jgi:hypothetical protein